VQSSVREILEQVTVADLVTAPDGGMSSDAIPVQGGIGGLAGELQT
jgi:hypothetical protein